MRQSDLVRVNPNRDGRRRKATTNMDTVSDALRELLDRQGLTREGLAGPVARRNKSPASRTNALDGEVVADIPREEDTRHRPLLGSVRNPGKLRLISNTCEPTRSKAGKPLPGVGSHLVLVWSDGHQVTAGRSKAMR